ncbi:hypothetical protein BJ138DRAFT_1129413 [Hygrophoropsis aurantiaca]|uniref:Uncharacterized protein n=1 Tax=Hygrophoropsis aurantiaca TaxID=72124 RepID=A0ACB8A269_9AGAM|nr:hypothetical protein BJ138DRAFT_1129413 [Hygrophoropsis aurantiaca]
MADSPAVHALAAKLRRRQLVGSRTTALATAHLLRQVLSSPSSSASFSSLPDLLATIRAIGRTLVDAQPHEHAVANTVRRVLHHVREEYHTLYPPARSAGDALSIAQFVRAGQPRVHSVAGAGRGSTVQRSDEGEADAAPDADAFARTLMPVVVEAIQDVIDELETVYDNISRNAKDHIHDDEIILTLGKSHTVEAFLKAAAPYRKYTVIIADTAPSSSPSNPSPAHQTALSLSSPSQPASTSAPGHSRTLSTANPQSTTTRPAHNQITTLLIPFSATYALTSRIHKLLLGAHAILATGGAFCEAGALGAVAAARGHRVPVVVLAGGYKMTPRWDWGAGASGDGKGSGGDKGGGGGNSVGSYAARDFGDPGAVLGWDEGALVDSVQVVNPRWDYVPPELVDVFITNDGEHPPSSVYRLIKEAYDDEDYEL